MKLEGRYLKYSLRLMLLNYSAIWNKMAFDFGPLSWKNAVNGVAAETGPYAFLISLR